MSRIVNSPAAVTLRDAPFRAFWASNSLNTVAWDIRTVAQAWFVLEITGSPLAVGAAEAARAGTNAFASVAGGVIVDRGHGKKALLFARAGSAALAIITGALALGEGIEAWHLIVLAALLGVAGGLGGPAGTAMTAEIVPPERLINANSINFAGLGVGSIVGRAAGGVLMGAIKAGGTFFVAGAVQAAALLFLLRVRMPTKTVVTSARASWLASVSAGIRYGLRDRRIAWLLVLTMSSVFGFAVGPLVPVFARDILRTGEWGYGLLLSAHAAGGIIGSVLMSMGAGRQYTSKLVLGSALAMACSGLLFAFSSNMALSLSAMFLTGAAAAWWTNALRTQLLTMAGTAVRGRVMALESLALQVGNLGWLLGGALGEWTSARTAMLTVSAAFGGANLAVFAVQLAFARNSAPAPGAK